jgi:hypothetical protein
VTSLIGGNMVFAVMFTLLAVISYTTADSGNIEKFEVTWIEILAFAVMTCPMLVVVVIHFVRLIWCNMMRISHCCCTDLNLDILLRIFDFVMNVKMLCQVTWMGIVFMTIKIVNTNWRHLIDIIKYWPYKVDKSYLHKDVRKTCIKVIVPEQQNDYHIGSSLAKSEPLCLTGRSLMVGGGIRDLIPTGEKKIRLSYAMAQAYHYFKAHKESKSTRFCLEGILYYAQIYRSKIDYIFSAHTIQVDVNTPAKYSGDVNRVNS